MSAESKQLPADDYRQALGKVPLEDAAAFEQTEKRYTSCEGQPLKISRLDELAETHNDVKVFADDVTFC